MFGRRVLATVALIAAGAQAQLSITNPSPTSWWGTSRNPVSTPHLLIFFSISLWFFEHTCVDLQHVSLLRVYCCVSRLVLIPACERRD